MDEMTAANQTAQELLQLLARRAEQQATPQTDQERFQALLAPVVIVLANIVRGPVQSAPDPDRTARSLMDFTSRWVLTLLGVSAEPR